jgi:ParB/RepB/Spo0J family partition protein
VNASDMLGIDEIEVGERARKDLGDLTGLMESIDDVGLLQPIVVTADRKLIAGGRRLEACRRLGLNRVPVAVAEHVTDAAGLLKAERDENTCRKDMTPSELVAIGRALEQLKRPEAAARKHEGQRRGAVTPAGKSLGLRCEPKTPLSPDLAAELESGKTDVLVAKALGIGGTSYFSAKALVRAAETGDEAAAAAVEEMDRSGTIRRAYDGWKAKKQSPHPGPGEREPAAPVAPPRTGLNGKRLPRRSLHRQLGDGLTALSGLCTAFAAIDELDDSIDEEEAARWSRDLSGALRVLRSLNTKLKEHSNGSH